MRDSEHCRVPRGWHLTGHEPVEIEGLGNVEDSTSLEANEIETFFSMPDIDMLLVLSFEVHGLFLRDFHRFHILVKSHLLKKGLVFWVIAIEKFRFDKPYTSVREDGLFVSGLDLVVWNMFPRFTVHPAATDNSVDTLLRGNAFFILYQTLVCVIL